jgi:hypothetical protein
MSFLDLWIEPKNTQAKKALSNVSVLVEKTGGRGAAAAALQEAVKDHFVGLDIIARMGGFPQALATLRGSLPSGKATRSGDMGELLATEYVAQKTAFSIPVKRLRYKDDRAVAMRGDDLIAIRVDPKAPEILKVEAKSRARLQPQIVSEAVDQLGKNGGRPNPSSLAFISKRLRERGDDSTAEFIEKVQEGKVAGLRLEHLVFTLSGNDCEDHLSAHAMGGPIPRRMVGMIVTDHQAFIKEVFDTAHG